MNGEHPPYATLIPFADIITTRDIRQQTINIIRYNKLLKQIKNTTDENLLNQQMKRLNKLHNKIYSTAYIENAPEIETANIYPQTEQNKNCCSWNRYWNPFDYFLFSKYP